MANLVRWFTNENEDVPSVKVRNISGNQHCGGNLIFRCIHSFSALLKKDLPFISLVFLHFPIPRFGGVVPQSWGYPQNFWLWKNGKSDEMGWLWGTHGYPHPIRKPSKPSKLDDFGVAMGTFSGNLPIPSRTSPLKSPDFGAEGRSSRSWAAWSAPTTTPPAAHATLGGPQATWNSARP